MFRYWCVLSLHWLLHSKVQWYILWREAITFTHSRVGPGYHLSVTWCSVDNQLTRAVMCLYVDTCTVQRNWAEPGSLLVPGVRTRYTDHHCPGPARTPQVTENRARSQHTLSCPQLNTVQSIQGWDSLQSVACQSVGLIMRWNSASVIIYSECLVPCKISLAGYGGRDRMTFDIMFCQLFNLYW